jgi:glycosyltransferase involved in cell wall biosynthesis
LSEGISNAVVEAMACGIPVVTTDCGGMSEAVSDGVEGLVVPIRDPLAMADAIERLYIDSELRARMGAAGRTRVERDFVFTVQAEKFLDLYKEALLERPIQQPPLASVSRDLRAPSADPDAFRVITIGELDWRNGYEYALQAVAKVARAGIPIRYSIVGDGPFFEAVGFARYELGLMDVVEIHRDKAGYREGIREADVFLAPAVAGGARLDVDCAIEYGLPIISTDAAGIPLSSNPPPGNRVVRRRDSEAIADVLMDLCGSEMPAAAGTPARLPR